jgi:hypothetical protein
VLVSFIIIVVYSFLARKWRILQGQHEESYLVRVNILR